MKRINKIAILTLIFAMIMNFSFFNVTYARDWENDSEYMQKQTQESTTLDKVIQGGNDFLKAGEEKVIDTSGLNNSSSTIFNILFTIGVALTVIVGGILGIKFMISSVEEKAQVKEMLIPYIVGCVVIYGAFGIWKLAITLLDIF